MMIVVMVVVIVGFYVAVAVASKASFDVELSLEENVSEGNSFLVVVDLCASCLGICDQNGWSSSSRRT